ncbi:septal ring lytic transglycosylase RlpA family lipoprotein [Flavobacterium album]|uniref:Probable endolytic peptidoglycan transglycosylase RlpA n=1 Tax=Flavobacterium album TaxID=2175091 RepID=A0A2S1QVN7_9FLAO|nr:septal ring lytic transglycosylase RlpA family protein [Flavobacterium album]AWH84291.1 septal ring lytic transglycosylase RlpA family lipoprotein [Flavobacterium album]
MKNSSLIFSAALLFVIITGFATFTPVAKKENVKTIAAITKADTTEVALPIAEKPEAPKLTLYKKSALATYYADKFNGKKTSSGERFHNKNYTAAHMKLPFGTMVRVTNESNGKSVDVKVNDRGPYSKKLEIDLTKAAFMEIASNKGSGSFKVKMEIIGKK